MRGFLSKSTLAENTSPILAAMIWSVSLTYDPFAKNSLQIPHYVRAGSGGGRVGVREFILTNVMTSASLLGSHAISIEWSMLCNSCISLQWMVAGVHGVTGAHALKRVVLDHSTAHDPVLSPLHHMEENHARDKLNRQEPVTRSFVLVCVMVCNLRNNNTGVKTYFQLSFGTLKRIVEIFVLIHQYSFSVGITLWKKIWIKRKHLLSK